MAQPSDRPSFFDLLGLDPGAPWDENRFRQILKESRDRWSRQSSGLGAQAVEARRNLHYLKSVTVMDSKEGRDKEAEKARLQIRDAGEQRRRDLEERLRLMIAKGYLLDVEAESLRTSFSDVLTAHPDLKLQLDQAPVQPAPERRKLPTLDSNTEDNLRTNLGTVRELTLYDVLHGVNDQITVTSPLDVLREAAQKLDDSARLNMNKDDPRIAAWQRLSALATRIFGSDEERDRYDLFMKTEKIRTVLLRFETVLSEASAIGAEQVELYFEEVRTAGVENLEMAKERLLDHFREKGWAVVLPDSEATSRVARKVQCPYCATLSEPGSVACRTCGFVLNEPCPSCGRVEPRYGGGCSCGFPIGQRPRVEELIVTARTDIARHDLYHAEASLALAERLWPLPPDRADRVGDDLRRARAALNELQHNVDSARERIEKLMVLSHYVTAEQELQRAPIGMPRREALLAHVKKAVTEARNLCRRAKTPGVPQEQAIELYMEALRICDDLEIARTALAAIPPAPPHQVRAEVTDPAADVLIRWEAAPDPDVQYVVMRGTGATSPESAEQLPTQQRLGRIGETSFRDRDAARLSGVVLRYAVLADRFGTYSTAVAAAPVVVATEATVTATSGGSRQIQIGWELPDRAIGVRVTRVRVGDRAEPVELQPTSPGRLLDEQVQDNIRYTVRVAYEDPAGGVLWSRGRSAEATSIRPPSPPGRLVAVGQQSGMALGRYKVQLRWPEPEQGTVVVVRQDSTGTLRAGDRYDRTEIDRAGHVIRQPSPATDYWFDQMTVCTYTPVLLLNDTAYVGAARHFADAPEVADLAVEFSGAVARIGWAWPEGCSGALVGYDAGATPEDPTVAGQSRVVHRAGDQAAGECELRFGTANRLHVIVGAVYRQGGGEFVTSGASLVVDRPRLTVRYEVRAVRRKWELVLHAATPLSLPALVLRSRSDRPPRHRTDGSEVSRLGPMRLSGSSAFQLPRSGEAGPYYRLFSADPGGGDGISFEPY
jgi:hypothetical protein